MSKTIQQRLEKELRLLGEHYGLALDQIEKHEARIQQLEKRIVELKSDREFLLKRIAEHKKSIVLHTGPDSALYGCARELRRYMK